jgi:hypothetical protein
MRHFGEGDTPIRVVAASRSETHRGEWERREREREREALAPWREPRVFQRASHTLEHVRRARLSLERSSRLSISRASIENIPARGGPRTRSKVRESGKVRDVSCRGADRRVRILDLTIARAVRSIHRECAIKSARVHRRSAFVCASRAAWNAREPRRGCVPPRCRECRAIAAAEKGKV